MSFQNVKNNNISQAKRTTIEDAIRAANLGDYILSKKENEGQNQSAVKTSAKNTASKAEANSPWKGLDSVSSTFNLSNNPKHDNAKNEPKESSVSALFALFQKEIKEIEVESEVVPKNEPAKPQISDSSISTMERTKKKTRWEKPITVPQMANTNLMSAQQSPMLYNPTSFSQTSLYQNPNVFGNNNLSFQGLNFGNNLIGPMPQRDNTTNFKFQTNAPGPSPQTSQGNTWRGYGSSNNMYNSSNNNPIIPPVQDKRPQNKSQLENYIERAFEKCQNEKERSLTEKALKKILNNAKIRGDYETRNWDTFPLPTIATDQKSGFSTHLFSHDRNTNFTESGPTDFDREDIFDQPVKVGALLAKRGFKPAETVPENRLEIGVNDKGKKVIKTLKNFKNFKNPAQLTQEEEEKRKKRQGRFHEDFSRRFEYRNEDIKAPQMSDADFRDAEEADYDLETLAEKWKVVGTSTALEKPYLRLTKEPDPSMVRPENILKKSLKMVLEKWKNKEASYPYVAEQFRSIRQDLTVQHIKNEFTVKVYESNARISLECHDVKYFNQCQSWLSDLYKSGLSSKNKPELFSYRIIHLTLCQMKNELNQMLQELTDEELSHSYVKFALELRRHMENGNVKGVFNLYKNGINLTSYLLDIFIHRVRIWALQIITKSFGDKTALNYLTDLLAFNTEDELKEFIKKSDGIVNEEEDSLLNKESYKIYADHPWMKMKLLNFKAAHA